MLRTITLTAALLSASIAQAGSISLTQPLAGATLHENGISMSVYFTDEADHYGVVATYLDGIDAEPARMRMGLQDGDAVGFSLPGRMDVRFDFARTGDTVTVEASPLSTQVVELR